ncbi:MAG TPA: PfkB family carbohydrate kinase [Anaerolineales bacterium]|nr:PfkB family carbohydrate kinase [Anaerolineales bacterium]
MLNRFAAAIDYLTVGHITRDLLPGGGATTGGTAAYATLTAQRLGLRPGILTAFNPEEDLGPLIDIPIAGTPAETSTTFENIPTPEGRLQRVSARAPDIHPHMLPESWRSCQVVHFGPVLDEIDLSLLRLFPEALLGATPQGWLRRIEPDGTVVQAEWAEAAYVLEQVDAAVLSDEDTGRDERMVRSFAEACRVLVVTAGPAGCRLFIDGFPTAIPTVGLDEVDATGAGDIFAAVFFSHLSHHDDPLEAARFAVLLATASVRRRGLSGVPTESEIHEAAAALQPDRTSGRWT